MRHSCTFRKKKSILPGMQITPSRFFIRILLPLPSITSRGKHSGFFFPGTNLKNHLCGKYIIAEAPRHGSSKSGGDRLGRELLGSGRAGPPRKWGQVLSIVSGTVSNKSLIFCNHDLILCFFR